MSQVLASQGPSKEFFLQVPSTLEVWGTGGCWCTKPGLSRHLGQGQEVASWWGVGGQTEELGLLLCSDAPPTLPFKAALNHRWLLSSFPSSPLGGGDETSVLCEAQSSSLLPPSLRLFQLRGVPLHCLCGLRGIYSQLETLICSRSLQALRGQEGQGQARQPCPEDMEDQALMFPASLQPALPPASCCTVSSLPLLCSHSTLCSV